MSDPGSLNLAAASAWAQVQILLNLGRIDEATSRAATAVEVTTWDEIAVQNSGPLLRGLPELAPGWMFFMPAQHLAVLNDQVLDEFGMGVTMFQFARVAVEVPAFRWFDVQNWRTLEGMDDRDAGDDMDLSEFL